MSFILSSDSCCDAFKSYLSNNNVHYLPMSYFVNDVQYYDDFDSVEQYRGFFDGLRGGKMAKTALANAFETADYFQGLLDSGSGDIIHLSLSSGLSGTAVNAQTAAREVMPKYPGRKIYAIDTKSATQGQLYLLDRAIEMRNQGLNAEETAKELEQIAGRLHHFVLVKDLFHLKRGGRVSAAAAVVGSVLNVRPILVINHLGELVVVDKVKGATKSLNYMVKAMKKHRRDGEVRAYIAHADDIETAQDLKKMLNDEGFSQVKIGYIGPVIGAHTGPGAIGLVFESTKRLTVEKK